MRRVLIPERWERIIELVEEQGSASVEEIARKLGISAPTVRRDLARIQQRGLVKRTRGGAEPSPGMRSDITLHQSRKVNPEEKELVGQVAAELVESGDAVMIDGGFTTYQVARHITASNIKIVTNSFDVAQVALRMKDTVLVMLGGESYNVTISTVGPAAEKQLMELSADKAIIGANSVSVEDGVCADSYLAAQVKRLMMERSREVIIVADYSKLQKSALYRAIPIEKVTTLVTDDKADEAILDTFRAVGIEVIVAARSNEDPGGDGSK